MEEKKNPFVTPGKTKLVQGSILSPEMGNLRLVMVPCSEAGKPDSQLHKLLDKKWRSIGVELKGWFAHHVDYKLGNIHTTPIQSDVWCIHTLCYDKEGKLNDKALASCVKKIAELAKYEKASLHVSTMVTNDIPELGNMLKTACVDHGTCVYFYEEMRA